jgi:20S proteasome subunit alpha 3
MARRYDSRTTTFSPEGRLYQVEYANEAINNTGTTLGVVCKDSVILAGEKKVISKLLDKGTASEKLYIIDDHIVVAVAGITADANILINKLRLSAQRFKFQYGEAIPVEQLVTELCDLKQGYTQFGGLRPFGVAFMYAGYDEHHGFQLYRSDPDGVYKGWMANAMGANKATAESILNEQWKQDMSTQDGLDLIARVLLKAMDTAAPTSETLEVGVLSRNQLGKVTYRMLNSDEIDSLMKNNKPAEVKDD